MTDFAIVTSPPNPREARRLLELLPAWFGQPASNEEYVEDATAMSTLLAKSSSGATVGLLLHCSHFSESAEIQLMAVDPGWHRRGVGQALIAAAESVLRGDGAKLLSVKTLGPSFKNADYEATRKFYLACGFIPVEELKLAGWDTPTLILVKSLI